MNLIEIIFLSIALGMDCLIVSFSQGLLIRENRRKMSGMLAFTMGFFQGLMPLIGYFLTGMVYEYLSPFAKWLVFGIFLFLGGKFLLEALNPKQEAAPKPLECKLCILLGIATSIDALGAGISLKLTQTPVLFSAGLIALGSFLMSLIGFCSGNLLKNFNTKYLEIFAGLILILLALKSLI